MEKEYEGAGKHRGMTPGRTKALMVLVAVITAIAIWLVPVDDKQAPPSLPELPSAPGTPEPLPLPSEPGMSGTLPPVSRTTLSGELPPPSEPGTPGVLTPPTGPDTPETIQPSSRPGTTETLALPPPPGGIATVTSGGEKARAFLYESRASGAQPDPVAVFAEAERMQGEGNLEDAYLLYRYAARYGQAQAAMTLGTQADPAFHAAASSYLPEPEPGQAHKWYSMAAAAGNDEAAQRLNDLRKRVERDAAAGDEQAQRLLLQWR